MDRDTKSFLAETSTFDNPSVKNDQNISDKCSRASGAGADFVNIGLPGLPATPGRPRPSPAIRRPPPRAVPRPPPAAPSRPPAAPDQYIHKLPINRTAAIMLIGVRGKPERDMESRRMMGWGLVVVESSSAAVVVAAAAVAAPPGGGGGGGENFRFLY